jgi:hypothetical protein
LDHSHSVVQLSGSIYRLNELSQPTSGAAGEFSRPFSPKQTAEPRCGDVLRCELAEQVLPLMPLLFLRASMLGSSHAHAFVMVAHLYHRRIAHIPVQPVAGSSQGRYHSPAVAVLPQLAGP